MLALKRRLGEELVLRDKTGIEVHIMILETHQSYVKLGIEAPTSIGISRQDGNYVPQDEYDKKKKRSGTLQKKMKRRLSK